MTATCCGHRSRPPQDLVATPVKWKPPRADLPWLFSSFAGYCRLELGSLKHVYKAPTVRTVFGLGPSPDPGPGAGVELGGGHPGGVGDLVGVGEVLSGQCLAPEDPPPAFLHVQPAGALGDEGVPDAGMIFQPGPGALAVVAGEVIGYDHDLAARVRIL